MAPSLHVHPQQVSVNCLVSLDHEYMQHMKHAVPGPNCLSWHMRAAESPIHRCCG